VQWLVLLEAERGGGGSAGASDVKRLLDALPGPTPGALESGDRYALQLEVEAPDPSEAIAVAVRRWQVAHGDLRLRAGNLVRVEALTREEFERECMDYEHEVDSEPARLSPAAGSTAASRRSAEDALLRHAFHDALTDLASQGLFRAQLEHALAADLDAQPCAVLLLDVDRLAAVNERLGRRAGDGVLVELAARLQQGVDHPGEVGRLGGDQFAVILRDMSVAAASATARLIVDRATAPMVILGGEVRPTLSAGIAAGESGDTAEDLLHRATLALRTAQQRGRARVEVFAQGMAGADVHRLLAERDTMAVADSPSYLGLLERLSVAMAACRTVEDAGAAVLRQLCGHARFPLGRLFLPDESEPGKAWVARTWIVGRPERFGTFGDPGQPLREGEGVAGQALASGRPVWVRDIASEPGLAMPHEAVTSGLRGAVAVPVVVDDRTEAVLEFFAEESLEFGDALLQLLATAGAHLATFARQARAERASTTAETRLRLLLGHCGVHVNVLGAGGKLRAQYPAIWPDDSAHLLRAVDIVHPDDMATAMRGWADALGSPGLHPPFECRIAMPDGSWRWVEVTAINMLDEPEIRAVVTYSREIDDRKRLEEDRRSAVTHLRDAEALAHLGTWHTDVVTGKAHWSEEMYRILGLEPGAVEPGAASLLALAHPDDRAVLEEQRRLVYRGQVQQFTFRIVGPGGTVRWIGGQASPALDASGRVVSVQGTIQDITERKAIDRALRESEQRLREVEAMAGVGSWRTDAATNRTVWSPQLYGILGLEPGSVAPGLDGLMACVHPDDRPGVEAHTLLQHRLALPMDFECRVVRPGGAERRVRIQLSVTYDNAGVVAAFHGLVWDTTGRTRNDRRLRV
jgi:diguanylate cyclase (GGDEF)-like protein/PAS domain S-box-containing protein